MNSTARLELTGKLLNDRRFAALQSNVDRAAFLLDNVLDYESAKKMVKSGWEKARLKTNKSLQLALSYLEEAELSLKLNEERLDTALSTVHKAILYVPTSELSIRWKMYAVKSDIHSARKEYREALYGAEMAARIRGALDINLVWLQLNCLVTLRRFGSAIHLIDQVLAQPEIFRECCSFSTNTFEGIKQTLQKDGYTENFTCDLSAERRKRQPYFSHRMDSRCMIKHSDEVGRFMVATGDIPARTVLLEERPYSLRLESRYRHRRCSSCYLDLGHKFYPCEHCTELIFCDQDCFQRNWQTQHRFECGFVTLLHRLTSPSAHVFSILSRVGPLQAFELEAERTEYSVEQYIADCKQSDVPDLEKSQEEKDRAYRMATSLCAHDEKHCQQMHAYHILLALETAILLELVHDFCRARPEKHFFSRFVAMIVVNIRRIVFNVFGWHEFDGNWKRRGHVANCQCLVGSLINHSCVPNANWEWKDGVIHYVASVAIPAGTEITITYGPNREVPYLKRQERLNQYFFGCNCDKCLEDARREDNLRCPDCDGPVLFNSAVNMERHLSGKCLSCNHQCPQYEDLIHELSSAKATVKAIASLRLVHFNEITLQQTVDQVKKMVDLSLPESESTCEAVLVASRIMQDFDSMNMVSAEQRIELALLLDEALPQSIGSRLVDGKTLGSLKHWLRSLAEHMPQVCQQSAMGDKLNDTSAGRIWNAAHHFHTLLIGAIHDLARDEPDDQVAKRLIDEHIGRLEKMLREMYAQFVQVTF